MTTRKPFSIRTQNELNISNKANDEKQKIIGDLPNKKVSTKIIKVNTRSNSKVYINKTLHVENKQNQQKEEVVKKIEDIENHSPVEEVKKETKTNIALPQLQIRKIYSIFELLQLEPTKSPSPIGFENWPEELKNPKPKDSSPFKPSKKSIQPNLLKRSPLGEAINTIINNSNNSVVCKNVESLKSPISPQKSLVSIPSLKIDSLVPSSPNKSNVEVDERRLEQRQKQIDLGKKTLSYYMYCKKVPIYERKKGNPFTPRKNQVCSKRSWDGQVRKWRRMLHEYDPQTKEEIEEAMLLFPEETKYLLQRKDEKQKGEEDEDSLEIDD